MEPLGGSKANPPAYATLMPIRAALESLKKLAFSAAGGSVEFGASAEIARH
jgi:hypothetical protein